MHGREHFCTQATNHDDEEEEEGEKNEEDVDVLRSQVARLSVELRAEKKRHSKVIRDRTHLLLAALMKILSCVLAM